MAVDIIRPPADPSHESTQFDPNNPQWAVKNPDKYFVDRGKTSILVNSDPRTNEKPIEQVQVTGLNQIGATGETLYVEYARALKEKSVEKAFTIQNGYVGIIDVTSGAMTLNLVKPGLNDRERLRAYLDSKGFTEVDVSLPHTQDSGTWFAGREN